MFDRELEAFGFEKTDDLIKIVPPDLFAELCQQSVQHLQRQRSGVDCQVIFQSFQAAGVLISEDELRKIIRWITTLFSTAAKYNVTCEELLSRLISKLPKQILQVIRHVWNEEGKRLSELEKSRDLLPSGELVDFQWKIGMAVSSDSCRSLNHPYVTIELKVADYSGQITSKVFELTIPEFQNFHKQVKEMSSVLETV
ncbi:COMM domain-containing protein 6 [Xenopus tropicalis]|uniref:COMM domain-containing protein 6 n=1 Tax=Xenopus tropicalis TaxID=8364 RepID=COMD6_XENTR|nr:COMM domain-containing protein 6 [Xenopus tropicalis]Q28HC7.1 RecName: Full=COMM domain-containing protein 6 [Xenopus tropicalis]CAJ82026.1 COMM domain containing 6 [Xenopus tropicalis]|eukprot:NP_001016464.1 COMM domain-containing protein 6 [Xenopus tropicalis]